MVIEGDRTIMVAEMKMVMVEAVVKEVVENGIMVTDYFVNYVANKVMQPYSATKDSITTSRATIKEIKVMEICKGLVIHTLLKLKLISLRLLRPTTINKLLPTLPH